MSLSVATGDLAAFVAVTDRVSGPVPAEFVIPKSDLKRQLAGHGRDVAFFTVARDGQALGRIMVHAPWSQMGTRPDTGPGSDRTGCFAHFDCADDPQAAGTLLDIAAGWVRARGLARIIGNVTLSNLPELGVVTQGVAPHTAQLLAENGFAPVGPMDRFHIDPKTAEPPQTGLAQQALLTNPDYSLAAQSAALQPKRLAEAEMILSAAVAQIAPYVPPFQLTGQRQTDPTLCAVLHHKGRPVACCLGLPDHTPVRAGAGAGAGTGAGLGRAWPIFGRLTRLAQPKPRTVVVLCGVIPQFQGLGIGSLLLQKVMLALQAGGYDSVSTHCTADLDGLATDQTGVRVQQRLQLFGKTL